jgi:hypothetical protein
MRSLNGRIFGHWFVVCPVGAGLDEWVCARTDRVNWWRSFTGSQLRRMRRG